MNHLRPRAASRVAAVSISALLLAFFSCDDSRLLAQVDDCADAEVIDVGDYEGRTVGRSSDGSADCGSSSSSPDVFYRFTADEMGILHARTCGSDFDTVLSIHSSCPASSASELTCNDDSCGLHSEVAVFLDADESVWIRVSGFNGASGDFDLEVEFEAGDRPFGPDPVPVDITELQQVGRVGSEVGLSMRTVICNLGDEALDWNRNPNPRHPFLIFNAYRVMGDRIEQIGRSWVKHGYAASQGGGCGETCLRTGGNQSLGVGCSDVYSVRANGLQSTFGPREEIDPWTGRFVYEGSHLDTTDPDDHDPIEHRLRIQDRDLDPEQNPGARYYVELHVVAHDDVDHETSIGYKEFTVSGRPGGTWEFAFVGDTAHAGTTLWDWLGGTFTVFPESESITEGRAYLKTKVEDNGDGTWHYEYAFFNLDMWRGISVFRVPVSSDVALTNIEFFAPRSFDESYNNEPWTATRGDGFLEWATTPFDEKASSNPLRWSTLYNFRFDADVAPTEGLVGIDLFQPGETAGYEGVAHVPSATEVLFKRGDTDGNGVVEVTDALLTASYLFLSGDAPRCIDASDANDSGEVDISDVVRPLIWLFSGGVDLPAPGGLECGPDETPADPPFATCEYDAKSC